MPNGRTTRNLHLWFLIVSSKLLSKRGFNMKHLATLLSSAAGVILTVLIISLYGYAASRGLEMSPLLFLPHLPGVSIALLAGCIGGTLEGLLTISRQADGLDSTPQTSKDSVQYLLKPILGSLSACVIFYIMAAGLTSLNTSILFIEPDPKPTNAGTLGYLIWVMTPHTPEGLSKLIVYSLLSGYFYPILPSLLRQLGAHLEGDVHKGHSASRDETAPESE